MVTLIGQYLPNLCAIERMPFTKKGFEFCAQKNCTKMLMKSKGE